MKTKSTATYRRVASRPVEVVLTVTQFRDIFTADGTGNARGTSYRMKLPRNDPRVVIKGENLYIRKPVRLQFSISAARGDKQRYYPVGIAFVREDAQNDAERLGFVSFPQTERAVRDMAVTVADIFADEELPARYEFSIVIQRGSDGATGIIDPGIVHQSWE